MSDGPALPPPDLPQSPPSDPETAESGKPWWKKWWVITLGVVFVLVILAGIFGEGDEDEDSSDTSGTDTTSEVQSTSTDAAATTTAPEAVATTEVATTTAPTTTEAPPTTPAPTAPPTTAAPAPPFVIQAVGDSVQEITIPDGGPTGIATITHDGTSNYAVWALGAGLEQLDLLVNEIGPYQGTVLLPLDGAAALEITANGNWTVEVKQITAARSWEGSVAGRGDDVLIYLGSTGVAEISHNGESNFAVFSYPIAGDGFADLLINEIGPYAGSVRFPGPALVEISADGDWTFTLS